MTLLSCDGVRAQKDNHQIEMVKQEVRNTLETSHQNDE